MTERTRDDIAAALTQSFGIIAWAARQLGMSRQALYERIARDPALRLTLEHAREELVDIAEMQLATALERGERWAVTLVLTRLGRHRGWGDITPASATPEGRAIDACDQAQRDHLALLLTQRRHES